MERKDKINLAAFIIVSGFAFSVFYHYISSQYLGLGYPFNTFLVYPDDRFNDFFNSLKLAGHRYESQSVLNNQFPGIYLIASALNIFGRHLAFYLFLFIFVACFVFIVSRNVSTDDRFETGKNIFIFSFLSYPFLFLVDRGSYEGLVFVLLYCFVYFHQTGRLYLSTAFLAAACAMKPFPLVFLVLLLANRQYKAITLTCITAVALTTVGYAFYGGFSHSVPIHLASMALYNQTYAIGKEGLCFGHSLFGLFKVILHFLWSSGFSYIHFMFRIYYFVAAVLFVLCAVFVVKIEREPWKKVAMLVFAMNLLPHVSADYKLVQLFVPLFMFFKTAKSERLDAYYVILFGLLLIPKDYYHFPHMAFCNRYEVSIAVVLNPLIMMAISMLIVVSRLRAGKLTGAVRNTV